jgi:hypothetical protein
MTVLTTGEVVVLNDKGGRKTVSGGTKGCLVLVPDTWAL